MSTITRISVIPRLPALPASIENHQGDDFESTCVSLSFFWLARCFHLSGNERQKEALTMRIQHLTRLYGFPDDFFEKLVEFGGKHEVDWSPRVPEIVGVRVLQNQLGLSETEYRILAFAFLCSASRLIGALKDFIEHTFCKDSQIDVISRLIGFDRAQFEQLTNDDAKIVQMHLTGPASFSIAMSPCDRFIMHPDVLTRVMNATTEKDDILSGLLVASPAAKLTVSDYAHLGGELTMLTRFVDNATNEGGKALSVLIVGMPGSGKTQLAKALCADAGATLYEVPVIDEDKRDKRNNAYRLGEYIRMSNMLKQTSNAHILFDEVEDVLNESENKEKRKGWINQTLERRNATTYWVCNDINQFDRAFLRRFDYVLSMPKLDYRSRIKMMKSTFNGISISNDMLHSLASQRIETPAKIEQLDSLLARIETSDFSAEKLLSLNFPHLPKWHSDEIGPFSIDYCNTDSRMDLASVASQCRNNSDARVLLTGQHGSGKTALARFLCFECNLSTRFFDAMDFTFTDPNVFKSMLSSAIVQANTKKEMLVIDGIDYIVTTLLRITPSPDAFIQWLYDMIKQFRQPLVLICNEAKMLEEYPTLKDLLDTHIHLREWSADVLQKVIIEAATRFNESAPRLSACASATPQQLISAIRQCRLSGDWTLTQTLLNKPKHNAIGFLAQVS